jgi:hypothetical protein
MPVKAKQSWFLKKFSKQKKWLCLEWPCWIPKTGEGHFLPIIGEEHIAAMPYEIILQDKQATMLHGRFRIALHWPDLTMGTFMKIMSTPGDIESTLKALCQ